jgi:hypothetical protein
MATKKKALKKKPAVQTRRELQEWAERGKALRVAEDRLRETEFAHQWKIADWIREGQKKFGIEAAYDAAQKATRMTRETLQQFAHTARKVLIRVKGVSFGHHRLVAKFKGTEEQRKKRQKKELLFARTKHYGVEKFAAYLKNQEKKVERQEITPTNADAVAGKVLELCQHLRDHLSLHALLKSDPPKDNNRRQEVLTELRATAEQLNKNADSLTEMWRDSDLFHYREHEAAAAARAGSSR